MEYKTDVLKALIPVDGRWLTKYEIYDIGIPINYRKKYKVIRKYPNKGNIGILCIRTKLNTYIPMEGITELTLKGFTVCK